MWPHHAEADYREPLVTFPFPFGGDETSQYGLFLFSLPYWVELLALVVFQTGFAFLTAVVIYTFIIQPKRCDTTFATMLGFGVLLPFWIFCPFEIIQMVGIKNLVLKFCVGVITPTLSLFRTTEAMYGFTPPAATKSLKDFTLYFASVLIFSRDKNGQLIKYPMDKVLGHAMKFGSYLLILGLYQSALTPYEDYIVFGERPATFSEWISPSRFLTWELYANSVLHAITFQLYLATYCEGLTFFWTLLSGYQVEPVMKNPIFESKSPSDFWGRRWNLLVHNVLKGGVYKPVRKYSSSITLAMVSVFLASGAFHEWLVWVVLRKTDDGESPSCLDCFEPILGGAMVFFVWQALLMAGEMTIGQTKAVTSFAHGLPIPLRTALVIAMGLPTAHFFCEPYFRSDFFLHGQLGLPMVLRVD